MSDSDYHGSTRAGIVNLSTSGVAEELLPQCRTTPKLSFFRRNVVDGTETGTGRNPLWIGFQVLIAPPQAECHSRQGRRWKYLVESCPKTCRSVLE